MMQAAPHHFFDRLSLGILVVLLAVPFTYVEVAHPSWDQVKSAVTTAASHIDSSIRTDSKPTTKSVTATTAAPKLTAPVKTATTTAYVHLRADKSVSSAVITDLNSGVTVQLRDDADTTWQGVTYQGKNGYIYRDYLQY